jgi:hypothetical protein
MTIKGSLSEGEDFGVAAVELFTEVVVVLSPWL